MTEEEFEKILNNFENDDLEFRLILERKNEQEEKWRTAKAATAFYNTRGGKIVFGIKEDGKKRVVIGLNNPQLTENNFNSQIKAKCNFDEWPKFEFFKYKEKDILIVNCPKGPKPPYECDKIVLIRRGSNNFVATKDEIARMYRDRSTESFDKTPIDNAVLKDMDLDKAKKYIKKISNLGELEENDEFRILNNLGIIKKDGDKYTPTIAGILLFGKNPQMFLPQAKIKIDIKNDDEEEWTYIDDLEGTIFDQIKSFKNLINANVKKSARIIGFRRVEEPEFPLVALRETIVNALVHRDYGDKTAAILVRIKKDSIAISNPGGIIPPLTLENILSGYFNPRTRNEVIAEAVLRSGFMERRGRGLSLILKLMKEKFLPEPKFIEESGSFNVELRAKEIEPIKEKVIIPEEIWKALNIDQDQRKILEVIEIQEKAKLTDFERALHKTRGAFNKKISYLLNHNIIERNPRRPLKSPKAYYIIHKRFSEKENIPFDKPTTNRQKKLI